MNSKDKFSNTLVMLADLTGKNMTEQLYDIYLYALEPLGLDRVNQVMMKYVEKMRFPSIEDIRREFNISSECPDEDQVARLFTEKVIKAMNDIGHYRVKDAENHFTKEEWSTIDAYGGWSQITLIDDTERFRPQFREFAKAYTKNEKFNAFKSLNPETKNILIGE